MDNKKHSCLWWITIGWWWKPLYYLMIWWWWTPLKWIYNKYIKNEPPKPSYDYQKLPIDTYEFEIAGLYYYKDNFDKYIYYNKDEVNNDDLWEGYSNTEIKENAYELMDDNQRYYEYPLYAFSNSNDIQLIIETSDEYEGEAVAVYLNKLLIGFAPRIVKDNIIDIIRNKQIDSLDFTVLGGRYKKYDLLDDKVKIHDSDYRVKIEIYYH